MKIIYLIKVKIHSAIMKKNLNSTSIYESALQQLLSVKPYDSLIKILRKHSKESNSINFHSFSFQYFPINVTPPSSYFFLYILSHPYTISRDVRSQSTDRNWSCCALPSLNEWKSLFLSSILVLSQLPLTIVLFCL